MPYIVLPGNHENYQSGELFHYRFRMPGIGTEHQQFNNYYTFKYRSIFFLSVNFDLMMQINHLLWTQTFQYIQRKLEMYAEDPSIKWRIFMSHKPFVCSDMTAKDCIMNHLMIKSF